MVEGNGIFIRKLHAGGDSLPVSGFCCGTYCAVAAAMSQNRALCRTPTRGVGARYLGLRCGTQSGSSGSGARRNTEGSGILLRLPSAAIRWTTLVLADRQSRVLSASALRSYASNELNARKTRIASQIFRTERNPHLVSIPPWQV